MHCMAFFEGLLLSPYYFLRWKCGASLSLGYDFLLISYGTPYYFILWMLMCTSYGVLTGRRA
jgi:hypothetical protein